MLTACSKLVDNFGQAVRAQLVDGLLADLLQDVRFLRVQLEHSSNLYFIYGMLFISYMKCPLYQFVTANSRQRCHGLCLNFVAS
jgi:hypothetical protein